MASKKTKPKPKTLEEGLSCDSCGEPLGRKINEYACLCPICEAWDTLWESGIFPDPQDYGKNDEVKETVDTFHHLISKLVDVSVERERNLAYSLIFLPRDSCGESLGRKINEYACLCPICEAWDTLWESGIFPDPQDYGKNDEVKETVDTFHHLISKLVDVSVERERNLAYKRALEGLKKYWYYAGEWHNAECDFILDDKGVCSCPTKEIRKNLKEAFGVKDD